MRDYYPSWPDEPIAEDDGSLSEPECVGICPECGGYPNGCLACTEEPNEVMK